MAVNLWNIQSPTKRIDLYFKIDEYKKHLLSLKNTKSTFKKSLPFFLPEHNDPNRNRTSSSQPRKPFAEFNHLRQRQKSFDLGQSKINSLRDKTAMTESQRKRNAVTMNSSRLDCSKSNLTMFSSRKSPKKFTNFKDWQINENNKIILKKLEEVKASPQLSKKNLFHQYSMSDLKYKMNLQKTRYKNVDFTKAAEKLLNGQKIKFSKICMDKMEKQDRKEKTREKIKISDVNLNWKLSNNLKPVSVAENINLIKELR